MFVNVTIAYGAELIAATGRKPCTESHVQYPLFADVPQLPALSSASPDLFTATNCKLHAVSPAMYPRKVAAFAVCCRCCAAIA